MVIQNVVGKHTNLYVFRLVGWWCGKVGFKSGWFDRYGKDFYRLIFCFLNEFETQSECLLNFSMNGLIRAVARANSTAHTIGLWIREKRGFSKLHRICVSCFSYVGQLAFFTVIHTGNTGFSLRYDVIVQHVIGKHTNVWRFTYMPKVGRKNVR